MTHIKRVATTKPRPIATTVEEVMNVFGKIAKKPANPRDTFPESGYTPKRPDALIETYNLLNQMTHEEFEVFLNDDKVTGKNLMNKRRASFMILYRVSRFDEEFEGDLFERVHQTINHPKKTAA